MLFLTRFTLVLRIGAATSSPASPDRLDRKPYMSLFGRLRLAITSERQDIEVVEKMVKKDEDDVGAKG